MGLRCRGRNTSLRVGGIEGCEGRGEGGREGKTCIE